MKKCFIICPIGEEGSEIRTHADESLKYVIEPACKAKGYEPIRADQISDNGMITQSIVENILTADLAIVDLTGRNPNVFYELAIRHSHGLPAIQITRDPLSEIPFDISNVRTIAYDLSASGADKARASIEGVIDAIEKGTPQANPVTAVSSILNLTHSSNNDKDAVLSELLLKVNGIPESLERLENNIGVRFSQMLTAFADSFKHDNVPCSEDAIKNRLIENLFGTIMTDPQTGMQQMQNLMDIKRLMEDKGYIKGEK